MEEQALLDSYQFGAESRSLGQFSHPYEQVYLLQGGGIGVPGMQIALSALQAHNLIPTSNSSNLGTTLQHRVPTTHPEQLTTHLPNYIDLQSHYQEILEQQARQLAVPYHYLNQHPAGFTFVPGTFSAAQLASTQHQNIPGVIKGQVQSPEPYVTYSPSQPVRARNVAQYLDGHQQSLYTNILPPQSIYEVLHRSNSESPTGSLIGKRKQEFDFTGDLKKAKCATRLLKAKRPGFTDERFNETEYYFEKGLRKVYPYYFTFTTFTKGRWVGETILDVFTREFRAHPREQYERCIKAGTLTVNYEKVGIDYKLKHNDLLANIVHRHEVGVSGERIETVHMDNDIVVVDKPASIPVHPCGRYRHNTMVFILAKDYSLKNLRTIHRLDRLTSGLLMFGRNQNKAREIEIQMRNGQVFKEYVCKVQGEFPRGITVCRQRIKVLSYKIGVCIVASDGKDSVTEFELLHTDGQTSIVLARPATTRMHQIRVHLQYLGFPILNDGLYNNTIFGESRGKGGLSMAAQEQLLKDLITMQTSEDWSEENGEIGEFDMDNFAPARSLDIVPLTHLDPSRCINSPSLDQEKLKRDENCYECCREYKDPRPDQLSMYIHALKYKLQFVSFDAAAYLLTNKDDNILKSEAAKGPGWKYETKLPAWAVQK